MKTAPASGYQKELFLDAATLREFSQHRAQRYFFFRTKDKFGKGIVGGGDTEIDQTGTIRLGVVFYLQPDGSRNLETED